MADGIDTLRADHRVLAARVESLEHNLEEKHRQNRSDIHQLRNGQQNILDVLHKIELKFARAFGWATGAGAVIALVAHFIDKI